MRISHPLTFTVLFVILSNPAFAQQGLSGDIKPDSALTGINELLVFLVPISSEPNTDYLKWVNLKEEVINRLRDAGFKMGGASVSANPSILKISLIISKIESCGLYSVSIRTSVERPVALSNGNGQIAVIANVWEIDSGIRIFMAEKMVDEVAVMVKEQVQAFIAACPPMVSVEKYPDANQPKQQLRKTTVEKDTKPAKQQAVEATFVASKNSQIFHKASCPSAKRISSNNLVSYATRDEAIAAGKKPCQRCNP
jgi:hypothetical protein